MIHEQKQNIIQQWKTIANTVWELFNAALDSLAERLRIRKSYTSRQPATAVEIGELKRLPLNLQFFAEEGGSAGDDDPNKQKDGDTDPPDGDDDTYIPLADLIKANPKYKEDVNNRINKAVMRRFKDIDPEEARTAIAEKRERDAKGEKPPKEQQQDDDKIKALNSKSSKLEAKTKKLAVSAYAAEKGLNAKLITALAGSQIEKLALDDDFEVDPDDIEEIVEQLRDDFPDQFPNDDGDDDYVPPVRSKKGGLNSSRQRTNQQRANQTKDDGLDEMEESFKRVQERYKY